MKKTGGFVTYKVLGRPFADIDEPYTVFMVYEKSDKSTKDKVSNLIKKLHEKDYITKVVKEVF